MKNKKESESKDEKIKTLEDELKSRDEKIAEQDKKALESLAAADALKWFEANKDFYPEDKHKEVKSLRLKIKLGEATEEEIMQLAEWKTSSGKTDLPMAGGTDDTDKGKRTPEELDALIEGAGVPVPRGGD